MTDCVRATLRANAFKGPFQGLGATLVRNVPANSIYLGTFEVLKDYIARWQGIKKADLPGSASSPSTHYLSHRPQPPAKVLDWLMIAYDCVSE